MERVMHFSGKRQAFVEQQAGTGVLALGDIYTRQHDEDVDDDLTISRCLEDSSGLLNKLTSFGVIALYPHDLPEHVEGISGVVCVCEFPKQRQALVAQALCSLEITLGVPQPPRCADPL